MTFTWNHIDMDTLKKAVALMAEMMELMCVYHRERERERERERGREREREGQIS